MTLVMRVVMAKLGLAVLVTEMMMVEIMVTVIVVMGIVMVVVMVIVLIDDDTGDIASGDDGDSGMVTVVNMVFSSPTLSLNLQ